ncbi:FAD-binding protein [Acuticoccus mangrovi]|uniref:FAD-binding protein n=1 Tax=Acuticoccus mangrovi TaxID=2796142 RepID=UPI001B3B5332|nr:FAD-binding protein [Acuticoccus mangrovi]
MTPRTAGEVRDAVAWAVSAREPLRVIGGGTKASVAPPIQTGHTLTLAGLSGIVAYEPEELVLTLKPGTPMAEVTAALDEANQMLAFEPPSFAPLLGSSGTATFGGTFGTNFAGPRRLTAGAVRDHMLGVEAVSGRGETFKAGGRVVKNVTGYDLARALAGSWGTLAVATLLTVKVLPRPETEATVVLDGLAAEAAVGAMAQAMGSSADVSGAAHLPADVAAIVPDAKGAATLLRLEGFGPSVASRRAMLEGLLKSHGPRLLEREASAALWPKVRDATPFVGTDGAVWRCSVAPTMGPRVAAALPTGSRVMFDWAGGLLLVETPAVGDAGAAALREAIRRAGGGHATLLRAPPAVRAAVPTFQPTATGIAALAGRLRQAFDPEGILNPGQLGR